jgi:chemotaxis protein methyltransferase CheR
MTAAEALPHWNSGSIKIVATDLDSNMVAHAHQGIYAIDRVRGIPKARLKQWFQRGTGNRSGLVRLSPKLRQSIDFHVLNLMGEWSVKGPLDAIFCRNVMIYFSKDTQRVLVDRFANLLAPRGHLFLGHSESLHAVSDRFESLGKTIYRKLR